MKPVTKIRKCGYCGKRLKRQSRGRPSLYCSAAHRQRAYERRRATTFVPQQLLSNDIYNIQTKDGIRRVVMQLLRELGLIPPEPHRRKPIKLVEPDDST